MSQASTAGLDLHTWLVQVGQKFAREIFFLGDEYSAEDAYRMGMVNKVVDHADLASVALEWGRQINAKSPTAQRMLKYSFNLIDDGLVGQQLFAGEATRLAYMTDEAAEGQTRSWKSATRLVTLPLALLRSAGLHQATADRETPQKCRHGPLSGAVQLDAACRGIGASGFSYVDPDGTDRDRSDRVRGIVSPATPFHFSHASSLVATATAVPHHDHEKSPCQAWSAGIAHR